MKLTITNEAYQRLAAYITQCPNEISGLGKVRRIPYVAPELPSPRRGAIHIREGAQADGAGHLIETVPDVLLDEDLDDELLYQEEVKRLARESGRDGWVGCRACADEYLRGGTSKMTHTCWVGEWGGEEDLSKSDWASMTTAESREKLEIYDIRIFEQTVTGASTMLHAQAMAKFLYEAMKRKENVADYRVWWHSHAAMQAFFSLTDVDTIDQANMPFLVSIVGNHDLMFSTRVDVYEPLRMGIDGGQLFITGGVDEGVVDMAKIKQEIAEKVSGHSAFVGASDDAAARVGRPMSNRRKKKFMRKWKKLHAKHHR